MAVRRANRRLVRKVEAKNRQIAVLHFRLQLALCTTDEERAAVLEAFNPDWIRIDAGDGVDATPTNAPL
jgi:hypothetical protein